MNDPAVEHYTSERVPNPNPSGDLTWQAYQAVRNAVVRCCRRFGPTGPMGECPITAADGPPRDWPLGDPDPIDYFVVDDQYNDERYIYVEVVRPDAFTVGWLRGLVDTLSEHPGWGVGITSFANGYALAFADRVMVTGAAFAACHDVDSIARRGRAP